MKNVQTYFFTALVVLLAACSAKTTKEIITEKVAEVPAVITPPPPPIKELPKLKEKDVLIVHGGWQGHKPKEYTEKIAIFLREAGAEVTVSPSTAVYEDSVFLASFDLIIQSVTMDKISKKAAKGLLTAVKKGKIGFAGCHGGTGDAFRENTAFQYMVGGQFVGHPGGQVDYSVAINNPNDAITQGLNGFTVHTEQYYMHIDPNVKVLATTQFSNEHDDWIGGATMPIAWKKYFGEGRVFYVSLGHDPELFDEVKEAKTILMRGFQWASGSKYEEKEDWISPIYSVEEK